jgi:hypothetical protein
MISSADITDLSKMVGTATECAVAVDRHGALALLDTGSMITCISQSFLKSNLPGLP